jgi:hypothetical protein
MDQIIEKAANREAAHLREGYSIAKLMDQNPHKKWPLVMKYSFQFLLDIILIDKGLSFGSGFINC